ncbi:hypothetical protein Tco_0954084 [Tanacetum coccineum]|uniref:CCHC-type domain-containing protein n=1 Tax=Tanacetum coccineum TaxID=301880 RepID=A0ABQ5E4E3_9ASTR
MASLDHRLNPLFSIKECSSCGALYTADFCCSKGGLEDKILVPKPPQNCATCGDPVDGLYCRSCAFVRKCLNEGWYTIHDENEILNTFESSNDNTNIVSAPQEPIVFNQDPGKKSSQSPPQINHNCCYKCGDSLDGIFCQRCTCKSCGNGAHIGYNCPPKAPIISNPEPCNQTIDELPQTLPSFDPTCYSEKENSLPYASKPNFVDNSPNVFDPPPQPPMYSHEDYTLISPRRFINQEDPFDSSHNGERASLNTIQKKNGQLIKSSVENLVPIPSESEVTSDNESECDMPVCDDFTTFSNPLFDSNDDFTLFDYLIEEFSGELAHIDPIPPGIEKADFDLEEEIRFFENLFDSLMEEIDLFLASDDSMPLGIEDDDYDSEGDIRFLEELLSNDSPPLLENESSNLDHFNDPLSPRPPPKPPDVEVFFDFELDTSIVTTKVVKGISEHYVLMPNIFAPLPTDRIWTSLLSHMIPRYGNKFSIQDIPLKSNPRDFDHGMNFLSHSSVILFLP